MNQRANTFDIAVVGAGIVGLATARALSLTGRYRLAVLEAEEGIARHQTGHNSGVIHSGLYYPPGSIKARTCLEGSRALYDYCEERSIPHERCGKLVLAVDPAELPVLDTLEQRGRAHGLEGLSRLDSSEITELEPHCSGLAALWVPSTGIVDFGAVARAYAVDIESHGGEIRTSAGVESIRYEPGGLALDTPGGTVWCRHLVNCGGLQSDRICRLSGSDPGLRIVPFRGEYYTLRKERRQLVRNLIYPVPDPELPFLGVHFTRTIHGEIEAGPNAVLALQRDGYERFAFSPKDTFDAIAYPGLWRLAARYPRTALAEIKRSLSRRAFVSALQRMVPTLRPEDIEWSGCGNRAQALLSSGELVDDFRFVDAENATHVLNAPSPAATASLAIGAAIAQRVESTIGS